MGVSVSVKPLRNVAQNIIYSPSGGTNGLWLSFNTNRTVSTLSCLTVFLSVCITLIKYAFKNLGTAKTFLQTRAWWHRVGYVCPQEGAEGLLGFNATEKLTFKFYLMLIKFKSCPFSFWKACRFAWNTAVIWTYFLTVNFIKSKYL